MQQLEALARRRFPADSTTADEAFNAVLESLSHDDWKRLARFDGRGSPQAYLVKSFSNALEDFARQRFGRLRPPVVIARAGGVWLQIFQWLIVEKWLEPNIEEKLNTTTDWQPEEIRAAIRKVKALAQPGHGTAQLVPLEGSLGVENLATHGLDSRTNEPEAQLQGSLREQVMLRLSALFSKQTVEPNSLDSPALDGEEVVIIRLLYAEGLSVAASARLLGRPEHEVRRQHKSLLKKLRRQLPQADAVTSEDS